MYTWEQLLPKKKKKKKKKALPSDFPPQLKEHLVHVDNM